MPECPGSLGKLIEVDAFCSCMQSSSAEKGVKPPGPRNRNEKQQIDDQSKIDQRILFEMYIEVIHRFFFLTTQHCVVRESCKFMSIRSIPGRTVKTRLA